MKPYYEHAGITIYHGDCREVLPQLPVESVGLIVTDPPYGVRWESNYRQASFGPITGDESKEAAVEATKLAIPALQRGRHIYLFGRYNMTSIGLTEPAELIWDKSLLGMGDLSSAWCTSHEYIQFYSARKSIANLEEGRGRLIARMRRGTVLRSARQNGAAVRHPSEKPVDILCELIESSSCRGELVLDYFCGVGSTLIAAKEECRKAIGIEIEERYCEIAAKRLSQEVMQFSEASA